MANASSSDARRTVNKRNEMIEATKFGVDAVLTDRTNDYVKLRTEMQDNWPRVSKETSASSLDLRV